MSWSICNRPPPPSTRQYTGSLFLPHPAINRQLNVIIIIIKTALCLVHMSIPFLQDLKSTIPATNKVCSTRKNPNEISRKGLIKYEGLIWSISLSICLLNNITGPYHPIKDSRSICNAMRGYLYEFKIRPIRNCLVKRWINSYRDPVKTKELTVLDIPFVQ